MLLLLLLLQWRCTAVN